MQTELAQLLVTLEMWWNCTRSDKEEQKGNKRFQRALLPLNFVTVDSFTVINSLTSSFCDKWGRTDWTRWLIYQWIASFPFKPRPHWWWLWFSTTSWGVYSLIQLWQLSLHHWETPFGTLYVPSTDLVVIVCKFQPTPQALHEEKKSSPPEPLAQMTVIRESHHSRSGEGGDVHGNWRHYMKPHCAYKKKKSKTTHRGNQPPSPNLAGISWINCLFPGTSCAF